MRAARLHAQPSEPHLLLGLGERRIQVCAHGTRMRVSGPPSGTAHRAAHWPRTCWAHAAWRCHAPTCNLLVPQLQPLEHIQQALLQLLLALAGNGRGDARALRQQHKRRARAGAGPLPRGQAACHCHHSAVATTPHCHTAPCSSGRPLRLRARPPRPPQPPQSAVSPAPAPVCARHCDAAGTAAGCSTHRQAGNRTSERDDTQERAGLAGAPKPSILALPARPRTLQGLNPV